MSLLLTLVLGFSTWAVQPDSKPKRSDFRAICLEARRSAPQFAIEAPEAGVETYFPVLALEASQTRFSFVRFRQFLHKALHEKSNYDHQRALYGMHKKIRAVFYRGKLFVIDGHHRALVSIYAGAQTIPVKIEADLSHLSRAKFVQSMEARGWANWRNYLNQPMSPVDFCDMIDDPNFQLARLIIRRVNVSLENGQLNLTRSRGAEFPVAVKINSDVPFFENHIADALRRGGVAFDDRREEQDLGREELAEYISILQEKVRGISSPLREVLLLDKPRDVAKLNLEKIVFKHLQHKSCTRQLRSL